MAREDLIPMTKRTKAEQKIIATKGGKKSGEARRQKKLMKEQIQLLLSLPLKDVKARKQLEALGIDVDNIDNQMAMIIAQYKKALKGDTQAFNTLRDTAGEKPKDEVEVNVDNSTKLKDVFQQLGGEELNE